jgi:hypothetical protein
MNLAGYFSSQAEALPRVSLRDRNEGALAFFGAENKRVKFNQVSEGPPALASPFAGSNGDKNIRFFGKETI